MDNKQEFEVKDYLDYVFGEVTKRTKQIYYVYGLNTEVTKNVDTFFRLKDKYQTREALEEYIQERFKVVAYNFVKKVVIEHENYLAQNN